MIKIQKNSEQRKPCRQGKQGDHQERLGFFCRQGPRRRWRQIRRWRRWIWEAPSFAWRNRRYWRRRRARESPPSSRTLSASVPSSSFSQSPSLAVAINTNTNYKLRINKIIQKKKKLEISRTMVSVPIFRFFFFFFGFDQRMKREVSSSCVGVVSRNKKKYLGRDLGWQVLFIVMAMELSVFGYELLQHSRFHSNGWYEIWSNGA